MPYPDRVERWRPLVRRHTPADLRGDPGFERVALAVLMAESGGNPNAPGDRDKRTGQPHSIGLYQLHDEGMGSGLSVAQRSDPDTNAGRAVPALAAAYRANRGDVTRTYIQAINPGALPDGPQVAGVLAAYGQGAGGGPKVQAQVAGGTVESGTAQRIETQLKEKRRQLEVLRNRESVLDQPAQGEAADDEDLDKSRLARLRQVQAERRAAQDDVERLEKEAAAEADKTGDAADPVKQERDKIALERERLALDAARAKATQATSPEEQRLAELEVRKAELAVQKAEADLKKGTAGPRATRTYKVGGVSYNEQADEAGGFQPLPPGAGVEQPEQMTPYQAATLPISQQNADSSSLNAQANYLQTQVAQGRLSFDQAKQVFDYVVAQQAPVEEGGKLYESGYEPSNPHRQFFKLNTRPYSVVDAAGFFGRPELNQSVYGPYPFGRGQMSAQDYNSGAFNARPDASLPSPPTAGGPATSGAGPPPGGAPAPV